MINLLDVRCHVITSDIDSETVLLREPLAGKEIRLPVPTFSKSGSAIRALGLKPGQEIWLSVRA